MDRIDNMTFKAGHQMGIWFANEELHQIKAALSRRLEIGGDCLNEIALEDIEIERPSQERIYNALYDLAVEGEACRQYALSGTGSPGVPCTGFWREDSEDLILYAWNAYQSKTIVVPREDWFIREDIVIH